ncbi:hypothetical protein ES703_38941 [subsurface metagenome]
MSCERKVKQWRELVRDKLRFGCAVGVKVSSTLGGYCLDIFGMSMMLSPKRQAKRQDSVSGGESTTLS